MHLAIQGSDYFLPTKMRFELVPGDPWAGCGEAEIGKREYKVPREEVRQGASGRVRAREGG